MPYIDQVNQGGTIYEIVPEIAELFSTTKTYHTGDHVIYEAGWYTFKADKSAGVWDSTKVDGPFKVTKQISDLKEDFNDSLDVDPEIEIGINRYISNGKIIKANNAKRASTGVKIVNIKKIIIIPNASGLYRVALFVYKNNVWSEVQSATNSKFTYTFTDEEFYAFQVLSDSSIPTDAVPFRMFVNTPSYIDKAISNLHADILGKDISWELGTLTNGNPTTSQNRIRSNYLKVKKGQIIKAVSSNADILDYSWFDPEYNFDETKSHEWGDGNTAVVAEDGYVRIILRKSKSNPTIAESEVDELGSILVIQDVIVGEMKVGMLISDAIQKSTSEIPAYLPKYAYKGEPISVGHKIAYEHYMTISTETSAVVQGCTAYGKYLFVAYNTLPMISIYDIETKSHIANIQMSAVDTYHCNNINFGSEKYDSGDAFPLLYVSMENIAEHKALVFRIQELNGTYSATLVQTITYPNPSEVGMYYPNCVIDAVNSRLCVMGYSTNSYVKSASNKIKVDIYDIPLLSDGDVQLNRANAKKSIEVKSLTATQGAFVNGDNIVQVYGLPQVDGDTFIGQLSLSGGAYTTLFSLTDIGLTVEPESVFMYDGNIYIFFVNRTIYKIYLA